MSCFYRLSRAFLRVGFKKASVWKGCCGVVELFYDNLCQVFNWVWMARGWRISGEVEVGGFGEANLGP